MQNFTVHHVAEIDSTNTRLLQWASQQPCHRVALVADVQTAGRGQRGRTWQAAAGDALLCSVAWQFERTQALDGLSLAVGSIVADALQPWAGTTVQLKWPNDLVANGRQKLGGILIETVNSAAATRTAVIGIGINLRTPALAPDASRLAATGLDAVAGTRCERDLVLPAVLSALYEQLPQFTAGGFAAFRDDWWARRAFADDEVLARFPDGDEIAGRMIDVTDRGALVIESVRGLHTFVSGEVSLRAARA